MLSAAVALRAAGLLAGMTDAYLDFLTDVVEGYVTAATAEGAHPSPCLWHCARWRAVAVDHITMHSFRESSPSILQFPMT